MSQIIKDIENEVEKINCDMRKIPNMDFAFISNSYSPDKDIVNVSVYNEDFKCFQDIANKYISDFKKMPFNKSLGYKLNYTSQDSDSEYIEFIFIKV